MAASDSSQPLPTSHLLPHLRQANINIRDVHDQVPLRRVASDSPLVFGAGSPSTHSRPREAYPPWTRPRSHEQPQDGDSPDVPVELGQRSLGVLGLSGPRGIWLCPRYVFRLHCRPQRRLTCFRQYDSQSAPRAPNRGLVVDRLPGRLVSAHVQAWNARPVREHGQDMPRRGCRRHRRCVLELSTAQCLPTVEHGRRRHDMEPHGRIRLGCGRRGVFVYEVQLPRNLQVLGLPFLPTQDQQLAQRDRDTAVRARGSCRVSTQDVRLTRDEADMHSASSFLRQLEYSLAIEKEHVRARLAEYGNDLLSLGVDGFRLDAAKRKSYSEIRRGRLTLLMDEFQTCLLAIFRTSCHVSRWEARSCTSLRRSYTERTSRSPQTSTLRLVRHNWQSFRSQLSTDADVHNRRRTGVCLSALRDERPVTFVPGFVT